MPPLYNQNAGLIEIPRVPRYQRRLTAADFTTPAFRGGGALMPLEAPPVPPMTIPQYGVGGGLFGLAAANPQPMFQPAPQFATVQSGSSTLQLAPAAHMQMTTPAPLQTAEPEWTPVPADAGKWFAGPTEPSAVQKTWPDWRAATAKPDEGALQTSGPTTSRDANVGTPSSVPYARTYRDGKRVYTNADLAEVREGRSVAEEGIGGRGFGKTWDVEPTGGEARGGLTTFRDTQVDKDLEVEEALRQAALAKAKAAVEDPLGTKTWESRTRREAEIRAEHDRQYSRDRQAVIDAENREYEADTRAMMREGGPDLEERLDAAYADFRRKMKTLGVDLPEYRR